MKMKLCNIYSNGCVHLAYEAGGKILDLTAAGFEFPMEAVISGEALSAVSEAIEAGKGIPVDAPEFANVVSKIGSIVCVGLNYKAHTEGINMKLPEYPVLFSKFSNALVPADAKVELPPWENSYDYEAELVIVIGKSAWGVSEEDAGDYIFGYTAGNDFSCRDPQMRSGQWLIGKTMPGFGPCGPFIVTADGYDPEAGKRIRSFVNSELRQDGSTADMIFNCRKIVSYASHYIRLEPGDLIFTGTPSGVALEGSEKKWLVPGDRVDVEIEGIGTLTNYTK